MIHSQSQAELLRENAELTASNARLREALKWFDDRIHVNPGGGVELCFNVTHGTMDDEETTRCKAALSVLTELPTESIAAITAPLEAKMHDLSIALYTAIDSLESLGESRAELDDLRKTLNQTPEQSLAAIQDAATKPYRQLCAEVYQIVGALDGPVNALDNLSDAANGNPLRHDCLLPYNPPNKSEIQDAARAEEREALDAGLRKIAFHVPTVCYEQSEERYVNIEEVFALKRIAADLRNQDNGGEAK